MIDLDLRFEPYDAEAHAPFVCSSFADSLTQTWPYCLIPRVSVQGTKAVDFHQRGLAGEFRHVLERRDVVAVVAVIDEVQVAWAARLGDRLLYAYTKEGDYRRKGIARALVSKLGLDPQDLEVVVWTKAAEKVARESPDRLHLSIAEELR